MSTSYKVKLNTRRVGITERLNRIARVYRKFYNLGLCYQSEIVRGLYDKNNEYLHSPDVRTPREAQVVEYTIEVYRKTPSAKGVDTDIIKAAAQDSYKSFMTFYKKTKQAPKFMPRNANTYFFRTISIGISGDFIKLSDVEVEVCRKNYLPQSDEHAYKNITFTYDGRDWWVSFVDTESEDTKPELSGTVSLEFSNNGNLLINGKESDENIFLSYRYRNVFSRYKYFKSDYKRKAKANRKLVASGKAISLVSKNMMEVNEKLLSTGNRLKQMKIKSFAKVASTIRKLSPSELYLPSLNTLKKLKESSSFQLEGGEIQELLDEVVKRLRPLGIKILRAT